MGNSSNKVYVEEESAEAAAAQAQAQAKAEAAAAQAQAEATAAYYEMMIDKIRKDKEYLRKLRERQNKKLDESWSSVKNACKDAFRASKEVYSAWLAADAKHHPQSERRHPQSEEIIIRLHYIWMFEELRSAVHDGGERFKGGKWIGEGGPELPSVKTKKFLYAAENAVLYYQQHEKKYLTSSNALLDALKIMLKSALEYESILAKASFMEFCVSCNIKLAENNITRRKDSS